jgi:hypothetical protein
MLTIIVTSIKGQGDNLLETQGRVWIKDMVKTKKGGETPALGSYTDYFL